ncbi:probable glutamate receptor [Panulirus ornatus]|uniref:probable glutamate receptor n=1 Tax=Panulirus ornatus TaxID=150431 RepID=UPI003A876CCA
MEAVLHHPSLRNSVHVLYLALLSHEAHTPITRLKTRAYDTGWSHYVNVYRRCLYCNNGDEDIQLLPFWNPTQHNNTGYDFFLQEPEDFNGHQFQIVALSAFPLSSFIRTSQAPRTTLTPLDSLDTRMLNAFAAHANFTYEVREPIDGQFGVELSNGNWTGTVGTLQHQQADFSLLLTLTPTRHQVVQYSIIYSQETIIIISLKPRLLPQHLAIIRPFTGIIWLLLSVSTLCWATAHWLLQSTLSWRFGRREASLNSALFYSWGALMQNWIPEPSPSTQVLVGVWLAACLILSTAYRSSLVAHLIVQDKDAEINTFHDLLARDGWQWGTWRKHDSFQIYFGTSPDSTVQKIHEEMKIAPREEQFRRVLQGRYSFLTFRSPALPIIGATYTNRRGYTPIHIGRTDYTLFAGDAWAFRKGAPFRHRISEMMQHLLEAGLVIYWFNDVIEDYVRMNTMKMENGEDKRQGQGEIFKLDEGQGVLGLTHIQGAFYLQLLGSGVAFLTLLMENLVYHCSWYD